MVITESNRTFEQTWDTLVSTLETNPNITVIKKLDHADNAANADLDLLPTREVFFGNPNLGTPIMQQNQLAGIDLPQKMLVWEDERGRVFVGYNHPDYLGARHDVGDAATLDTIEGALATFAGIATDNEVDNRASKLNRIARNPGLVFVDSNYGVDETYQRLIAAIEAAPPNILFMLEHDANADRVGLDLAPTKLIVFGNPVLGTPLMQQRQTIGLDLPQKFLVFENPDGSVQIAYNDPFVIAKRHRVRGQCDLLSTIANALAGLSGNAAGATSDKP